MVKMLRKTYLCSFLRSNVVFQSPYFFPAPISSFLIASSFSRRSSEDIHRTIGRRGAANNTFWPAASWIWGILPSEFTVVLLSLPLVPPFPRSCVLPLTNVSLPDHQMKSSLLSVTPNVASVSQNLFLCFTVQNSNYYRSATCNHSKARFRSKFFDRNCDEL